MVREDRQAAASPLRLMLVVPCYNEEDVLPETRRRLCAELERLGSEGVVSPDSGVLFVDDGSTDKTWTIIEQYADDSSSITGVKLSRNYGHQKALLAGLLEAPGDLLVSIDADLQDDTSVIREMVLKYRLENADVVYGVRSERGTDGAFKRMTAEAYYRLLKLLGVEVVFNHADYRLLSRQAVEALRQFDEAHLFLRALVPLLGFKTAEVRYSRHARHAGETKYPLPKMLSLAWEGVTSFSARPVRMISVIGFIVSTIAFLLGIVAIVSSILGNTVAGWASTIVAVFFLGGVQLVAIGLIGEYIGKIYLEVKRRPRYIIESAVNMPARKTSKEQ